MKIAECESKWFVQNSALWEATHEGYQGGNSQSPATAQKAQPKSGTTCNVFIPLTHGEAETVLQQY